MSAGNSELDYQRQKNRAFSVSIKSAIFSHEIAKDDLKAAAPASASPILEAQPDVTTTSNEPHSLPFISPEHRYYAVKELDHPPAMVGEIDTQPLELSQFEQGGEIKIQLWIDEKGNVVQSEILDSNLPQPFKDYTTTSFKQAKFAPGIKDGVPVKTLAKIVVQFAPNNW